MEGRRSWLDDQPHGGLRSGAVGVIHDGMNARLSGWVLHGTRRHWMPITPHLVSASCRRNEHGKGSASKCMA